MKQTELPEQRESESVLGSVEIDSGDAGDSVFGDGTPSMPGKYGGRLKRGSLPGSHNGRGSARVSARERARAYFEENLSQAERILRDPKSSPRDRLSALDLLGRYGIGMKHVQVVEQPEIVALAVRILGRHVDSSVVETFAADLLAALEDQEQ